MGIPATLLLAATIARAGVLSPSPQVGDTYELTLTKDSLQHGSNASSGSSHDQDTLIEHIIGQQTDGLELEYDLPSRKAHQKHRPLETLERRLIARRD
jgi:hypothetical protein